ncbi:transcription factor HY5-like isoform X2 [Abrus precatorius]|uniref:Transcription factor HY5 n=1 Tax=Abrus precatorius TaxID=3816 RepID=A0A8B8LC87_ABRPR|nr:transcription factor HY5-like isoform X2 [Abrus precatorius]
MSLSKFVESKPNSNSLQQLMMEEGEAVGEASSSGNRLSNHPNSFPPLSPRQRTKPSEDSDEDVLRVPDCGATNPSSSNNVNQSNVRNREVQAGKRHRGRNSVDKEHRRLKRLLRNRVSAQQARERKKVYVNDLESRAKELEDKNSNLEERISTLINENTMLRKVLMNMRPKVDESIEA